MNRIEKLNTDPLNGRDLYLWELDHLSELTNDINLSSQHYICFVAWNDENISVDEISNLAEMLIKSGASYICVWGANCERVHDIIDEIDAYPYNDFGSPEDSTIMTTWHAKEPLEEALFFFLNSTWPDEYYEESTKCSLAIVIGNREWSAAVREALTQPREYSEHVLNKDEN